MNIEQYHLSPTKYVPNSRHPVLVYRNVLPHPRNEDTATAFLTRHEAWKKGGTWGHDPVRHFHPNTHECYGIFQGHSLLLLGIGPKDETPGQEIPIEAGDVIVLPAGTAHSAWQSSDDYRFVGVYPSHSKPWRNEYGEKLLDLVAIRWEIDQVASPELDPVTGEEEPLVSLWKGSSVE